MWRGYEKSSLFSTVLHWPVCLKSFVILADMVQVFLYSGRISQGVCKQSTDNHSLDQMQQLCTCSHQAISIFDCSFK